ncbi:MAG TPA: chemotaxis protein CheB [Candidatus Acidoferrales bacterium]|nr:chemotaxis protein CheB [Candidatus Acidoferrales bacterium]
MKSRKPNHRKEASSQKSAFALEHPPRQDGARGDSSAAGSGNHLLIAAIGASAGGIESSTDLIAHLPADTGMAFVLIQHLDPSHESGLAYLLAKKSAMRVHEVKDGMRVEPNNVYVIPPNARMSISDHTLSLSPRGETIASHMTIDHFMRSLAEAQRNRAIGVILSGYGTDGTLGMAEIQAQGGVTFAQDEKTAKFANMPRSAIAAGCVDYVLPPRGIAHELARIARHPFVTRPHHNQTEIETEIETGTETQGSLNAIFHLLRHSTGVDFNQYRQTTLLRRIHRRMVVHKMDDIRDYVKYARSSPTEIKALYQDMLINVTSFFRNPSVFEGLKNEIFPAILKNQDKDASLRIWTPGCASGEETYSVAIVLLECLGVRASHTSVQLFGTDVNEASVIRARAGIYPENIESDVSAERLQRFFTKAEDGYHISKNIRDMCIFAQHNVLSDPPFSQMDLICCRNLLIYLEPRAQARVISLFHYAARPAGYLVLGTSEGVGVASHLFAIENRSLKFFSKKGLPSRQGVTFSLTRTPESFDRGPARLPARPQDSTWNYIEIQKEFDRRLLNYYAPAAVFTNSDLEIIHTRGNVSRYFKLAPGRASLSILKMAREGLLLDLRNAIGRAKKENAPVRKQNVRIQIGNGAVSGGDGTDHTVPVNFQVVPFRLNAQNELYFMIVVEDAPAPARTAKESLSRAEKRDAGRAAKLEQELAATKEYLQSVIETQEATNEELQSANEQILSSNEELQSTNEELETAKEELQSANEELSTVNDELRGRNAEATQFNTDLINLLESIDMAILMVDSNTTIRRFTPRAQELFGLLPHDVGRPLANINASVQLPDFQQMVRQVMTDAQTIERTLTAVNGKSYRLRVVPYKLHAGKIDGTVITVAVADP